MLSFFCMPSNDKLQDLLEQVFDLPAEDQAELMRRLAEAGGETDFDERYEDRSP